MAGIQSKHTERAFKTFLDIPGEEVILVTRSHWIFVIPSLLFITFLGISCLLVSWYILLFFHSLSLIFSIFLVTLLWTLCGITKILTDWFFHAYIITNHKIIELLYSPFFFYKNTTVLLDEVRCTEIDIDKQGLLEVIFNFGNIILTFDRPTHSEEFVVRHVYHPGPMAMTLRKYLLKNTTVITHPFAHKLPVFYGRRMSYA